LLNNFVKDLTVDSKGVIWIGMHDDYTQEGGVTKYNKGSWASYTVSDGLVDDLIRRLCTDTSDNVWVATGNGVSKITDQNAAIDDPAGASLIIYPNPADSYLTIDPAGLSGILYIYDLTGNLLGTYPLTGEAIQPDVCALKPGIYLLQFILEQTIVTKKLIIR